MANVLEPDWKDRDDPGLLGRTARAGAQAGAERLGATMYEIAPGSVRSPLHAHHANEEMIIVLTGSPLLRTPDSERRLATGEVIACLVGRQRAHQVVNDSDQPVRVLAVSTMVYPEVVEMLDSDKILAQSAPPGAPDRIALAFPREAHVDRLAGEPAHQT